MLSPAEEKIFRDMVGTLTPMRVLNPAPRAKAVGPSLKEHLDDLSKVGKMPVVNPNDDQECIARVRHVMKKGEPLMEFFARTGLGRAQIFTMTKSEITAFVDRVEQGEVRHHAPQEPDLTPLAMV